MATIDNKMTIEDFIKTINNKIDNANEDMDADNILTDVLSMYDGDNNFDLPDDLFFKILQFEKEITLFSFFFKSEFRYKLVKIFDSPSEIVFDFFNTKKYYSLDLDEDGITVLKEWQKKYVA